MSHQADARITALDPPASIVTWPREPWLLVVARGHARLLAELRAVFRDDPRVQVIEDRRDGQALLPRGETRATLSAS
jgi:hypothetical protein